MMDKKRPSSQTGFQNKNHYKESSTGLLKGRDGHRVEYNRSTGKFEAIK